ncbi:MAG TPA: ECF-type sigma factor, partial [Phycisphaerales bacterium]|nr:ECF-type sigma factor [Phycisphaerales bacterium]
EPNVDRGEVGALEVESLLSAAGVRGPGTQSEMLESVYAQLRSIAGSLFRAQDANHTLQPTALVHEAFMKITSGRSTPWEGQAHFVAVAAKAMRQILVDHARQKRTLKRGAGERPARLSAVAIGDEGPGGGNAKFDALDVHESVERLAKVDARQARIAELRYFAGLEVADVARLLGVSERTVELDWRMARAWLRRDLEEVMT